MCCLCIQFTHENTSERTILHLVKKNSGTPDPPFQVWLLALQKRLATPLNIYMYIVCKYKINLHELRNRKKNEIFFQASTNKFYISQQCTCMYNVFFFSVLIMQYCVCNNKKLLNLHTKTKKTLESLDDFQSVWNQSLSLRHFSL